MSGLSDKDFSLFSKLVTQLVDPGETSRAVLAKALSGVCGHEPPREYPPQSPFDKLIGDLRHMGQTKGLDFVAFEWIPHKGWVIRWTLSSGCPVTSGIYQLPPQSVLEAELARILSLENKKS